MCWMGEIQHLSQTKIKLFWVGIQLSAKVSTSENWMSWVAFYKAFLLVERSTKMFPEMLKWKVLSTLIFFFFLLHLESLYGLITRRCHPQICGTWHLGFPVVQHSLEIQSVLSSYSWVYALHYSSFGYYIVFSLLFILCSCRWNR